jgi:hypothetical protein
MRPGQESTGERKKCWREVWPAGLTECSRRGYQAYTEKKLCQRRGNQTYNLDHFACIFPALIDMFQGSFYICIAFSRQDLSMTKQADQSLTV